MQTWAQEFACHSEIPDRGCDQCCEWCHALKAWAEIWEKSVSLLPVSEEESWLSRARWGLAAGVKGADGKVVIERLCLSLPYVEKPVIVRLGVCRSLFLCTTVDSSACLSFLCFDDCEEIVCSQDKDLFCIWLTVACCYFNIYDIGIIVSVRQYPRRPGFSPRLSHTKDSKNDTWCLLA